jgi:hypothetical protein
MRIENRVWVSSRFVLLAVFLAVVALVQLPAGDLHGQAQTKPEIITFDAPGAGTGPYQGTEPIEINPEGAITGFYFDSNNVAHGFLRKPYGKFITFDAPGAGSANVTGLVGTPAYIYGGQGTYAISINPAGAITGFYVDKDDVWHGFLRHPDGKFITINVEGAGTGAGQGTEATTIDPAGVIQGNYITADGVYHVFVRDPGGRITKVDVPNAGTGAGQGTLISWALYDPTGAIAGEYIDANGAAHGFVRASGGKITEFDVPGAVGTYSWAINTRGMVTATYIDANYLAHGYLRAPNGKFTYVDATNTATAAYAGTWPEDINDAGTIVGNYYNDDLVNHAFIWTPDGKFTYFEVPGAGTGAYQGTTPLTNNPAGAITGLYIDNGNVSHGFLRLEGPRWSQSWWNR